MRASHYYNTMVLAQACIPQPCWLAWGPARLSLLSQCITLSLISLISPQTSVRIDSLPVWSYHLMHRDLSSRVVFKHKRTSGQAHKQTSTQVHKHTRIEITKGTVKLPSRYDDNALYDSHRSAPSYHLEWNSTCTSTDLHDREMDIVRLIGSISGWECAKREHHTEKPCHPIKNWHHQKYNTSSKI